MRFSVLTVLDLNELDVTLKDAGSFGPELS